jgi:glycosyltransferase involved in cell wall biosynthesis
MKFSVLMSVYTKEQPAYLKQAIDSVLNQTVAPDEVVIVEDGPLTSELYKVLDTYSATKTIKRFPLEKNQGLGKALNYGIKKCANGWIARMDSDDISVPDRFELQIDYISNHPEVGMIGSAIDEYDETMSHKTGVRTVPEIHEDIVQYMKSRNPFNHMTVIYKKQAVLEAGNYQDCPYFEDYYLWCRMAKNGTRFHNIQQSLVYARAGAGMIERRGGKSYAQNIYNFQKKIHALGLINTRQFIANTLIRSGVAIIPPSARTMFYGKALRK